MRKRLGKVAEMTAICSELFRIEPEVIGISEQFFKEQLRLFQLAGASQAFDVPKRAGGEASFRARQTVHMCAINFVTTHKRIFYQAVLYRSHRRKPHWVDGADESHHRHQQRRSVQIFCPFSLHKRLQLVIPEVCKNIVSNLVSRALPDVERSRERALQGQA